MSEKPQEEPAGSPDRDPIETRRGPGGESAFIAGTRVRVSDVAQLYGLIQEELVVERIVRSLPHLTPAQVRAAIEYWRSHEQQISDEIAEERAILANIPMRR